MGISFKEKILHLLKQYYLLLEKQKEINCSIYDVSYHMELLQKEKYILSQFGLPDTPKYHLFLANPFLFPDLARDHLETIYNLLASKAERHLSKQYIQDEQFLKQAKIDKADPFDTLPEISVSINSYTLYLYNEILLNRDVNEKHLMREFKKASVADAIACIYMLCIDKDYMQNEFYFQLSSDGFEHLSDFLRWYHTEKSPRHF